MRLASLGDPNPNPNLNPPGHLQVPLDGSVVRTQPVSPLPENTTNPDMPRLKKSFWL